MYIFKVWSIFLTLNFVNFSYFYYEDREDTNDNHQFWIRDFRVLSKDSDSDGLIDEEENYIGTDIYDPDSDDDGYSDGTEVESGTDPLDPFDPPQVSEYGIKTNLVFITVGITLFGLAHTSKKKR